MTYTSSNLFENNRYVPSTLPKFREKILSTYIEQGPTHGHQRHIPRSGLRVFLIFRVVRVFVYFVKSCFLGIDSCRPYSKQTWQNHQVPSNENIFFDKNHHVPSTGNKFFQKTNPTALFWEQIFPQKSPSAFSSKQIYWQNSPSTFYWKQIFPEKSPSAFSSKQIFW